LPILTHVGARDDVLIAQRIRAELARGGQVLYVDHCVNLLAVEAAFLAKAVPECRLAIAAALANPLAAEIWALHPWKDVPAAELETSAEFLQTLVAHKMGVTSAPGHVSFVVYLDEVGDGKRATPPTPPRQ